MEAEKVVEIIKSYSQEASSETKYVDVEDICNINAAALAIVEQADKEMGEFGEWATWRTWKFNDFSKKWNNDRGEISTTAELLTLFKNRNNG